MDKFAANIEALCTAATPYVWSFVIAAFLTIGVSMIVPSEKAHEKAKAAIPYVIIGAIIAVGCVYIGKWVFGKITFAG